jgi:hypothetical protein
MTVTSTQNYIVINLLDRVLAKHTRKKRRQSPVKLLLCTGLALWECVVGPEEGSHMQIAEMKL